MITLISLFIVLVCASPLMDLEEQILGKFRGITPAIICILVLAAILQIVGLIPVI